MHYYDDIINESSVVSIMLHLPQTKTYLKYSGRSIPAIEVCHIIMIIMTVRLISALRSLKIKEGAWSL